MQNEREAEGQSTWSSGPELAPEVSPSLLTLICIRQGGNAP